MKIAGGIRTEKIKRCLIDARIKIKCPGCERVLVCDFLDRYLSYPVVGEEDTVGFYCEQCDEDNIIGESGKPFEWSLPIKIVSADMVIEFDLSKLEPE